MGRVPASPDRSADEILSSVQTMIRSGDLKSARIAAQEALNSFPRDARVHNFLGVIAAQQHRGEEAETCFRRSIQLEPRSASAYINLGHLYQENALETAAGAEKALSVYNSLLAVSPQNVEGNYQSAFLLTRLGKFELSLARLARLPAESRDRSSVLALQCANEAGLNRVSAARSTAGRLERASDLHEMDVLPIVGILVSHGQEPIARGLLASLSERRLASDQTYDYLARLYENAGEGNKAKEVLNQALSLPGQPSVTVLNGLARNAYRASDLEGALGFLAHARDLEPENAAIHFLVGLICIDLKLPPEADKSLREAVRLQPDDPYYNYALAAVLLQEHKPEEAIEHFRKFCHKRPKDARGSFALGVAYFDAERSAEARRELELAARSQETSAGAWLYLSRLAVRNEDLADAEQYLQTAVRTHGDNAGLYIELGQVQLRRKEYGAAARTLARALELAPDNYQANLNLVLLYRRTNDPRAAEQALRLAKLQEAGEERERMLLRSLDIHPY